MSSSHLNLGAGAAGFLILAASVAHAGVSVQGTAEAVRIEAKNASIEEVLGTLREAYNLTYTSKVSLGAEVTGTYEGPLPRVIALLLKDMNFVLAHQGQAIHVLIASTAGRRANPGALPPPPAGASAANANPQFPAGFFPPPPSNGAPR